MPEMSQFSEQINIAQAHALHEDQNMLAFGLGMDDPTGIFGTTEGLAESHGGHRVFDMPTAENAMTGIGIGAAIGGSRVLMTHQRLDFFLLAMDQLVNNAAKWHYMFDGKMQVPLTIRLILGRGWGQGPTHAQNLQSWFAHIPGLKVVVPSRTQHVASLLYQSIMDNNPVVFLEHRWLHGQTCDSADLCDFQTPLKSIEKLQNGEHLTLIANSYMLLEVLKAADILKQAGINCDVLDVTCINPIDWQEIYQSVAKTGKVIICDCGHLTGSFSGEISARITEHCFAQLSSPPVRLALPDHPEPTSYGLTTDFYNSADDIVLKAGELLACAIPNSVTADNKHDVPGAWFKGPF